MISKLTIYSKLVKKIHYRLLGSVIGEAIVQELFNIQHLPKEVYFYSLKGREEIKGCTFLLLDDNSYLACICEESKEPYFIRGTSETIQSYLSQHKRIRAFFLSQPSSLSKREQLVLFGSL